LFCFLVLFSILFKPIREHNKKRFPPRSDLLRKLQIIPGLFSDESGDRDREREDRDRDRQRDRETETETD
jgi:hypothetical protein